MLCFSPRKPPWVQPSPSRRVYSFKTCQKGAYSRVAVYPTPRRLYHLTWNLTKQTSAQSPNNDSPTALRGLDAAGDAGIIRKEGWEQARRRHRLEHVDDEQQSCATQAYFAPEKVVTCASSQLLRCFYIFPGKGLKISRTSASMHRKKNSGRHIFFSICLPP